MNRSFVDDFKYIVVKLPWMDRWNIAAKLGFGSIDGPVHKVTTLLLRQDARRAHDFQSKCTVGGPTFLVECFSVFQPIAR